MRREHAARRRRVPDGYELPREPEDLLPWSYAVERLTSARNYWLATCRPSGAPHTTPVWGIWLDDALYLDGPRETRWAVTSPRTPGQASQSASPPSCWQSTCSPGGS